MVNSIQILIKNWFTRWNLLITEKGQTGLVSQLQNSLKRTVLAVIGSVCFDIKHGACPHEVYSECIWSIWLKEIFSERGENSVFFHRFKSIEIDNIICILPLSFTSYAFAVKLPARLHNSCLIVKQLICVV